MSLVLLIIISFIWFSIVFMKSESYLHILQLEGYNTNKLKKWMNQNKCKIYRKSDIYFSVIAIALIIFYYIFYDIYIFKAIFYLSVISLFTIMGITFNNNKKVSKKPFIYTKRAKRLSSITLGLILLDLLIVILLTTVFTNKILMLNKTLDIIYPIFIGFMIISYLLCIYYVILGNLISLPLENKINKKFYIMAREKIKNINGLKTIGITGSYGKTSTKFISSSILSQKFRVMNTPESYNTPMGISKVINNDLTGDYEIFIAEMGATQKGDIEELAILAQPEIGVITSIGPCHLESFGSIENIANCKYELIEHLSSEGIAIFNYDNPYVRALADKTEKTKILYAIENTDNADIYAKDIAVNERGSSFTLCIRDKGSINCETSLLGKHNILNILAAVSIASALGMNLEEISLGIKKILPVKHRLELIDPKTGIIVIDDAFNSNPDGAQAALEIINEFKDRRKIIVTPGMVELGEIEKAENEKFGEKIARICDIVILVGKKRTQPIYDGLIRKGFDVNNIFVVNSTDDSTEVLKSIAKPGDVVLYENDLPDTYEESVK